jgi:L-lactate dehydrogenase complex protein LldE
MNVSLFITCLTDTFYPRTGMAVVKILEHLGCHVDFPQAQTCCGQPMYNTGFHDDCADLARRMVRVFEHSEHVITPSGSCAAMIRDYYADLLKDDPAYASGATELAGKTYEFIEFLVKVMKVDLKALGVKWEGKTTYHYSCHLRGIGVTDEAVQLMNQIEGLEYVPLPKQDQCCGFGGAFSIKYPPISGAMVNDKVGCIQSTHTPMVVSNDAGCTMNIAGACRRQGVAVGFKSLPEIIAEGLGLLPVEQVQPVPAGTSGGGTSL